MKLSLLRVGRGSLRLVVPEEITDTVQRKIYKITLVFSPERHMKAIIVPADFPSGPLRGWGRQMALQPAMTASI